MANLPIQSTTGDPIFRSQSSSINSIRSLTRAAADASIKLNTQERLVSPGEDALSFSTSRQLRSEVSSLRAVSETGQLNITGLGLAVDSLEGIKSSLDDVKRLLVQSQVASPGDRDGIQAEIDLTISQIDSAAQNTKLGSRSLLNGESSLKGYATIANDGTITDFNVNQGQSLAQTAGVTGVTVNKIGAGGTTKTLNDGTNVLSLTVSLLSGQKATKAVVALADGGAGAGDFVELRVTGKLGSATVRIASDVDQFTDLLSTAAGFNALAAETGVVLTSAESGVGAFTTVGFGADEFVKVEVINASGNPEDVAANGNTIDTQNAANGTVLTDYGTAAIARINGTDVELGGEHGTTARYLNNGFDIEVDFSSRGLTDSTTTDQGTINIDLTQGVVGLLGTSGSASDTVQYGIGNFTSASLGRGNGLNTVTVVSDDGQGSAAAGNLVAGTNGNQVLNNNSVADIASGGQLSLDSGNIAGALRTIDSAIDQVIDEQTRLGTIQGNFIDAVNRAESSIGNLSAADADIIGVDAATEITNLVQSQLGISTASSVLSQANAIQATVASLLRG